MIRTSIVTLVACVLLGGCAGERELHAVASQSGAILSTYRTAVRDFASSQNGLNTANESRLTSLAQMREIRRAEIDARVATWRLSGDDRAVKRLAILGESSADEVLANAAVRPAPLVVPALAYDSGEIEGVIKQLVELEKPVSLDQRLVDLIAYGEAFRTALKAELDENKDTTKAAADATTSAATTEEADQAAVSQK